MVGKSFVRAKVKVSILSVKLQTYTTLLQFVRRGSSLDLRNVQFSREKGLNNRVKDVSQIATCQPTTHAFWTKPIHRKRRKRETEQTSKAIGALPMKTDKKPGTHTEKEKSNYRNDHWFLPARPWRHRTPRNLQRRSRQSKPNMPSWLSWRTNSQAVASRLISRQPASSFFRENSK